MSREKQIEKMAKDFCAIKELVICEECHLYKNRCHAKKYATRAYNAGYRKASEVAREIFEEIEKRLDDITIVMGVLDSLRTFHKTMEKITAEVAELKKKYTEEGK